MQTTIFISKTATNWLSLYPMIKLFPLQSIFSVYENKIYLVLPSIDIEKIRELEYYSD